MNIKEYIAAPRRDFDIKVLSSYIIEHPKEIQFLCDLCSDQNTYPFPEYSSWTLIHVAQALPNAVQHHLPVIIDTFLASQNHSSSRNLLKVITLFPKQVYKEEELINRLFDILMAPNSKPALVVYGCQQLQKYFHEYPEFKSEVISILELLLSKEKSPAIAVALRNLTKSKS
ncbi:MAG: hypothetical protein V4638_03930 [Bacteroidota bacterium]